MSRGSQTGSKIAYQHWWKGVGSSPISQRWAPSGTEVVTVGPDLRKGLNRPEISIFAERDPVRILPFPAMKRFWLSQSQAAGFVIFSLRSRWTASGQKPAEFSLLFGNGFSQKRRISVLPAMWRTRQDSNLWPLPSELELQRYARLFNPTLEHDKSLFIQ